MNALVVVQCRYASTRLPGKALYPLGNLPILVFLLKRLTGQALPATLCLATTIGAEDDVVAAWGEHLGIPVVRGERDDVLARYLRCQRTFNAEALIRVTADNPLTDPAAIQGTLMALKNGADYADALAQWPIGTGVDGFSAATLSRLDTPDATPAEREHLNLSILNNPERFSLITVQGPGRPVDAQAFTIDTLDDYLRIQAVTKRLGPLAYQADLSDVVQ